MGILCTKKKQRQTKVWTHGEMIPEHDCTCIELRRRSVTYRSIQMYLCKLSASYLLYYMASYMNYVHTRPIYEVRFVVNANQSIISCVQLYQRNASICRSICMKKSPYEAGRSKIVPGMQLLGFDIHDRSITIWMKKITYSQLGDRKLYRYANSRLRMYLPTEPVVQSTHSCRVFLFFSLEEQQQYYNWCNSNSRLLRTKIVKNVTINHK